MKLLTLVITLVSLSISATEISVEEFIQEIKANRETLSKLEVGMSAESYKNGYEVMTVCEGENCHTFQCTVMTTELETIIAVFKHQHYVHVTSETTVTGPEDCHDEYSSTYLALRNNPSFDLNVEDFKNVIGIQKIENSLYIIDSIYNARSENEIKDETYIDINKSFFYSPLFSRAQTNWGQWSVSKYEMDDQNPGSFDLSNIKLQIWIPLSQNSWTTKMLDEDDYSFLLSPRKGE